MIVLWDQPVQCMEFLDSSTNLLNIYFAILIKMSTDNQSWKSVVLESSDNQSLGCNFGSQGLARQRNEKPLTQRANLFWVVSNNLTGNHRFLNCCQINPGLPVQQCKSYYLPIYYHVQDLLATIWPWPICSMTSKINTVFQSWYPGSVRQVLRILVKRFMSYHLHKNLGLTHCHLLDSSLPS